MHGGTQPRGIASPNIKHGRYSKDMPTRMLAAAQAAASDPELLNLSDEIALTTARLTDLLHRVDSGESGALWAELKAVHKKLQAAQRAKNGAGVVTAMHDMADLISRGHADAAMWREIGALMEQRRKLVETEQKRRVAMQTMFTAEQGGLIVTALLDSVRRNVSDRDALAAIASDISSLFSEDGR